jgi:hypothetical protein
MTKAKPKSQPKPSGDRKHWILYAVLIALLSWTALYGLVHLPINPVTKALFFVLLFTGIASTVLPPAAYLNARFGRCKNVRVQRVRFVRQSIWSGLLVAVAAWLQMRRALSLTLAVILIAVFVLTETFLITREAPAAEW